ncbi:MAG: 3'(2'),5'-bisphosphate nucleotidase [Chloroflexi bacterium]|nr:3'(2'),5'-bisphosphate nucleotidase [Chloroflexota bacterium]MQC27175.1 3'(2'),5'-bisphosphate nucleotidase [Chloroflexota bacterium]
MIDLNNPELKFAVDAVRQAASLAARVQAEMVSPALTKNDRSPVSVADYVVQALIAQQLETAFPDTQLVGEEDAGVLRAAETATLERVAGFVATAIPAATTAQVADWIDLGTRQPSSRYWTLDPIDGTKGFLRREQYAVALALIEEGQVQLAALGCPNLAAAHEMQAGGPGSLVIAARDQGAWFQPLQGKGAWQSLQVSPQSDRTRARLLRSAEAAHTDLNAMDEIAQHLGVGAEPVRMDSQAKYAVLAAGEGELLFRLISPKMPDYKEKIWDQAAGSLIVEEAGGKITDLDGKPLNFKHGRTLAENRGVLASNGHLHKAALEAIRAVEA